MEINYLKQDEIIESEWNKTISQSAYPLTYAYTWYLNTVCDQWDALVGEDYSILMPLPYRTKFNQIHIYTPPFVAQLGYFFKKSPDKSTIEKLFKSIPKNTNFFHCILNKLNIFNDEKFSYKKNYYSLDLYNNYEHIYNNYSQYIKKILEKKPEKKYIISSASPNDVINFLNKIGYFYDNKMIFFLRRIISITTLKRLSTILAAYSETNELIGIGIFIFSSMNADLLLIAAEDDNIKTITYIIDKFIKNNAGKSLTLNFECTFSQNANKIYQEFGAVNYYKTNIKFKRPPKIFRFFYGKDNRIN